MKQTTIDHPFRKSFKLSLIDYVILDIVKQSVGLNLSKRQIANFIGVTKMTIMNRQKILVKKGFVTIQEGRMILTEKFNPSV